MAKTRILVANCYDYPQYYDVALPAYTKREADFIEAACRKYCPFDARRFLEPACGAGRLITELAARGYEVAGFDLSRPALSYLRRRLARQQLHAETFEAEMSDFRFSRPVDAAYCTVNTFRHLLTEQAARGNLVYRPQPSSGRHLYPRLASAAIACQESTPGAGRSGEERQK
jgi:SAM-dependent methyltransferase